MVNKKYVWLVTLDKKNYLNKPLTSIPTPPQNRTTKMYRFIVSSGSSPVTLIGGAVTFAYCLLMV